MCFESAPSSRQISPKNKVLERNKSILKAKQTTNDTITVAILILKP